MFVNGYMALVSQLIKRAFALKAFFLAAYVLYASGVEAAVPGPLSVSPTRLIFKGQKRAALVNIVNKSNKVATYKVELKYMELKSDGSYAVLEKSDALSNSAKNMFMLSPKKVVLEPGELKKVRVLLQKPKSLKDGEYRVHMAFSKILDSKNGINDSDDIIGVSIPIIVTHGNISSNISIKNTKLSDNMLSLLMERDGNASVYGDLAIYYTPEGGKAYNVAKLDGISVLYPLKSRSIALPLNFPEGVSLEDGGQIKIKYITRDKGSFKELAQGVLEL